MRIWVWAAALGAAVAVGCEEGSVAPVRLEPVLGPERVDFGLVRPGEEVRRDATFENPNSVVLEASLSVEGPGRASFSAPSRIRLDPGATEIELTYLPVAVDSDDEAEIRVTFPSDPDVTGPSVALIGRVAPSALSLEPLRLDLGPVVVGSTVSAAFRVADRTGRDLDISLQLEPGSQDFGAPEPAVITGSGGFEVGFVARRRASARRAAQVVAQAGGGGRARGEIFAEVVEAPLRCTSPLDLGYLSPGASAEATATCENVSTQTLIVGTAAATDAADPPDRSRWSASLAGPEVSPGGTVELRVRFEALPADEDGQGFEAQVEVPVSVAGQGGLRARPGRAAAVARVGLPALVVSPRSLDFGRVMLGTTSSLLLTLENRGRWPVRFDGSRVVGSDGFILPSLPELLPGERAETELTFSPSAVGAETGTAEFAGPGYPPVEVPLSGEGFDGPPCENLRAWPELPFGSVYADYARTLALRLENQGESDCVVGPFAGRIPPGVPVDPTDGRQVILGPGERQDIAFRYLPTEESRLDAELRVYVNGSPSVLPVRLTGAGVTWRVVPAASPPGDSFRWPAIALPTELRFHLGPGCASQEGFVDVTEHWNPRWEYLSVTMDPGFEVGQGSIEGPDHGAFEIVRREPARPFWSGPDSSINARPSVWTARYAGARWVASYRPPGPGQHRAWLRVPADGIPEPVVVPLFGDAGPRWVEDVIAPDPPLDVLVTVGFTDPSWLSLLGQRSDIADGLGALWEEGVDLQVSTISSEAGRGWLCAFSHERFHRTSADFTQPPSWAPDGSCSFFARGTDAAGPGVDWRRITHRTMPSPREALRALVGSYWTAPPGGSDRPADIAAQALGFPLRRTGNEGFLRPGGALAILALMPDHSRATVAPFEWLVALRGTKRSSVMLSVVSGPHSPLAPPLEPSPTCEDLQPDGFERAVLNLKNDRSSGHVWPAASDEYFFSEFVMPSGGRAVLGTCTANWADWIVRNGLPVNGFRTRYPLEELADGSSVEVTVGGARVPERAADGTPNWWYEPEFNRVDFSESAAPRRGDEVRFRYLQRCSEPL